MRSSSCLSGSCAGHEVRRDDVQLLYLTCTATRPYVLWPLPSFSVSILGGNHQLQYRYLIPVFILNTIHDLLFPYE